MYRLTFAVLALACCAAAISPNRAPYKYVFGNPDEAPEGVHISSIKLDKFFRQVPRNKCNAVSTIGGRHNTLKLRKNGFWFTQAAPGQAGVRVEQCTLGGTCNCVSLERCEGAEGDNQCWVPHNCVDRENKRCVSFRKPCDAEEYIEAVELIVDCPYGTRRARYRANTLKSLKEALVKADGKNGCDFKPCGYAMDTRRDGQPKNDNTFTVFVQGSAMERRIHQCVASNRIFAKGCTVQEVAVDTTSSTSTSTSTSTSKSATPGWSVAPIGVSCTEHCGLRGCHETTMNGLTENSVVLAAGYAGVSCAYQGSISETFGPAVGGANGCFLSSVTSTCDANPIGDFFSRLCCCDFDGSSCYTD